MAIGARSQSARTYLEKHLNSFKDCDLYELINHGIKALASTLPNETKLNNKNLSICLVGKDTKFKCLDETETEGYITAEAAHGTRSVIPEGDPSDVGVGSSQRRVRGNTPPPNEPPEPIPDVTPEQRRLQ